jgi:agmatinase
MKVVFNHEFIGSRAGDESARLLLLGCPLDATSSFRGGTKFAPESIRKASWTLETYSPYLKQDLEDLMFCDAGNLELRPGDLSFSLDAITDAVSEALQEDRRVIVLGGEHLVSYPILRAVQERFKGIQIVHFDAHCDMRDEYEGQRLSHATVMKRIRESGVTKILQVGIRSGTRREFEEADCIGSAEMLASRLDRNRPVYLSFDMDVFDPSLVAGVTTPEPGGLMFGEVMQYLSVLDGLSIVGADIVELAPDYDTTFVSSICAAKVVREILMLVHQAGG